MGKNKKGYNWRARSQLPGNVDLSQARVLEGKVLDKGDLRSQTGGYGGYEGSNALVMPAEGNRFTKDKDLPVVGKILSRKQRKRLEQIVEKKKKKESRAELLAALKSVQADSLEGYESLASVQTKGVKRQLVESKENLVLARTEESTEAGLTLTDSLGRKRKRRAGQQKVKAAKRPDVIGFETESECETSSGEESDEETEEEPGDLIVPEETTTDSQEVETPAEDTEEEPDQKADSKPVVADDDDEVVEVTATSHKPTNLRTLTVSRPAKVEEGRSRLPILGQEQEIMEMINNHGVVVLSGETGCGKTTQLPQFLYEAGYTSHARIGVTEPRRVAATSMAKRVAEELGVPGDIVSYQIRYEGNVTERTKIKFMTDGVLLREIERDFLLTSYSVIIIDEAHERSVFTDILIGLLSRIVPLRLKKTPESPLKVIIMSATLRVEDFTSNSKLFKVPPPVVSVDSRQFPVTVHFNKKTNPDYMSDAFKKVCKIHSTLPEGGILVFLTGQQEVNVLVKKLRAKYPGKHHKHSEEEEMEQMITSAKKNKKKSSLATEKVSRLVPNIDLSDYNPQPLDDTETDVHRDDDEDDDDLGADPDDDEEEQSGVNSLAEPLYVLPLYSLLSSERQQLIWAGPPPGSRLCVVATNIAETSLTIPGVKYVVDTGKVKVKHYDKVTGVSTFLVDWISQAQASQRAGRAGRQGPGHCYRLYSSAVYSDLAQFSRPEILSRPVEDLLLQMKAMNIEKVINFPFPTSPDTEQLRCAELRLQQLGALQAPPQNIPLRELEKIQYCSSVTALGRCITNFPLAPRFGKMLALAHQHALLPLTLTLVSALTVQEVLIETELSDSADSKERKLPGRLRQLRKEWAGQGECLQLGDPMVLLQGCIAAEREGYCPEWCASHGLRAKAMLEIRRLRRQLAQEVTKILPGHQETLQLGLEPPDQSQARLLQQLLLAGSPAMVARRISREEEQADPACKGGYRTGAMEQLVFIHNNSVLRQAGPDWVVYQDLFETPGKIVMRGVTAISPHWLPVFCPSLVRLGCPLSEPAPSYTGQTVRASYQGTFGPQTWQLPITDCEMSPGLDKYKWFARFLLEGSVAPELAKYTSSLLSNPLIMVKSWSNLQKRTELVLKDLARENCDSGTKLGQIWSRDSKYLLSSYLAWLPEVVHDDVTKLWPPSLST